MSETKWDLADRYVCINLLERTDRLEQAKARFEKVGLGENMTFHRVERHPRGGRYGCYESHRSVIEKAYKDGLNSVLIFEDDVLFVEGWETVVKDAKEFLDSKIPFDALFLGSNIFFVDEKTTPSIWRVKCVEAHAYIVSRAGMEAYLGGSERFNTTLATEGQDMIQNSLWKSMYSHSSDSIIQDDLLGTDHIWFDLLPASYAPWFQKVVMARYSRLMRPLKHSDFWIKSYIGSRVIVGMDDLVVNDGRLHLKGMWFVDTIMYLLVMIFSSPPHGMLRFIYDILHTAVVYLPLRLGLVQKVEEKKNL